MASKIKKEDVQLPKHFKKSLAFVLYNVFTKEECEEYINIAEKKGFEEALLNAGGDRQVLATDVRKSSRCIWDTTEEVDKMWKRIKKYIPDVWCHREVMGLNERLRILRYDPGEYFKPHYDGSYKRDNGERSYVTVQIYLNEGFKGGSTTFLGVNSDERVEVVPKTGSVLVFEHPILHEGSELIAGRKYTIRTDVMYSSEITEASTTDKTKKKSNFLSKLFG
ncbi:uncharacterized protein LOC127702953 [Mytilus californianus]|uniref:uncharacterized protein LOC127702953 n=1 Tax=Mytilus californianus TaxID=6549 RepID=UPI002245BC8A|nr:uncharacterized protein LOC127702953 [Mytilus californianus]